MSKTQRFLRALTIGICVSILVPAAGYFIWGSKAAAETVTLDQMSDGEVMMATVIMDMNRDQSVLESIPVSNLRRVSISYDLGDHSDFMVHADQVDTFVQAQIEIHQPGGRGKTARYISVWKPHLDGPYWWTVPSLDQRDAIENGALVFDWGDPERIWENPEN